MRSDTETTLHMNVSQQTALDPMEWVDRRVFPRLPIETTVRYGNSGQRIAGSGFDLSENGIGFLGSRALPVGASLEIEFCLNSSDSKWFSVTGIVRRLRNYRMGVEFTETDPAMRANILRAICHESAIECRHV